MGNSPLWGLMIGTVLPPLIAVFQRSASPPVRVAVMLLSSLIAGIVTVDLSDNQRLDLSMDFDDARLWATVAAVATAASSFYRNVWRPTGVAGTIEEKTGTSNDVYIPKH
jgi:hypothetical protein